MTEKKATATLGAGFLAVLTLLLTTQGLEFMRWGMVEFKVMFGLPMFMPLTVAVVTGAFAPAWLPHALPESWPPNRTKRVTRLLGFCIAFGMIVVRYPHVVGVQYGLFAGTGAYMLWTVGSGLVYARWPKAKPSSLEPPRDDG
ncbi:MAG TPA: hypothetical protein VGE09_06535 [Pseudoxanthomonas sp.]